MDEITLTGLVATRPKHLITAEGLAITTFRLASSEDDGPTNWYTVQTYRALAKNVAKSISKGHRVILTGSLRIRDWDNGERTGTSVEVEAATLGHDLSFGVAEFERTSILRDGTLVPA
jgi:single-strand DNA-binding protein